MKFVGLAALLAAPASVAALLFDSPATPDAAPGVHSRPLEAGSTLVEHSQAHGKGSQFATRAVQQEIEQMARRADRLAKTDEEGAKEVDEGLEDVEAALETRAGADAALAQEIRATRGALCAKAGFKTHERADCLAFMRLACIPGTEADQSQAAELLPVEVCRHFFVDQTAGSSAWSGPAPAPGPEPYSAQAPAGAPAQSPEETPKEWFSKELQSLPEQGLSSDDRIRHEDGETQTDDWLREFGPKAGHRSYRAICRDHPNNEWCRLHMKYDGDLPTGSSSSKSKSASSSSSRSGWSGLRSSQEDEEEEGRRGGAQSSRGLLAGSALLLALCAQLLA